jgi:hypothetical protein
MSTQVECPLCGRVSKNNMHPHRDWGLAFRGVHVEDVMMSDFDVAPDADGHVVGQQVSQTMHEIGRETFWCSCGRMLWMEGCGWLVSLDFITNLCVGVREMAPADFAKLLVSLALMMPQEIDRVRKAIDP